MTSTSVLDIPPSIIASPSGDTLIQQVGTDTWIPATEGMKIEKGDRLQTGDDGTVLLIFFEGSVMEIGVNSEVIVTDPNFSSDSRSTTVKLKQVIGNTVNRVERLVDPASLYEVSAPAEVAAVRGTLFELKVADDDFTEVTCQEGQVSFTAAGITVTIEENMTSSALPGEVPSAPSPQVTIVPTPDLTQVVTPTPVAENGQVTTQTPIMTPTPTPIEETEPTPTPTKVEFADANLEAAIREAIGKPSGDINRTELEGIANLNASARGISNLSGLEYCTNLTDLRLRGNELSDISPLANPTHPIILDLNDNQIDDISPLMGGLNLGHLKLQQNQISDIYPLVIAALGSPVDCEDCYLNLADNPLSAMSLDVYTPQLQEMGITVYF
jgi:hypothetical protein